MTSAPCSVATAPYILGLQTTDEHPESVGLAVTGSIPDWVSGVLLRTTPARFEAGKTPLKHWFDGQAMLHRFAIHQGQVTYRSRYMESAASREAQHAGELVRAEFGTDPCRTVFERVAAVFHPGALTDNCNVNVTMRGEEIIAMTETPMRLTFDPDTLHIGRTIDDAATIKGQVATAHPHHDAARATSYSYLLHLGITSTYKLVTTDDETGTARLLAQFVVAHPSYVHSFGMSENYLIMALGPFVVDPLTLAVSGKPFIRNYHWRPELGLRLYVIDKNTGAVVVETTAPAAFLFHHVNAYEDDGALMVDLLVYADSGAVEQLDLGLMRSATASVVVGQLRRYRIILANGRVDNVALSDTLFEFPQINYGRVSGQPYQFAFGAGSLGGDLHDCIVKVDTITGKTLHWTAPDVFPGEPVFVPDPHIDIEDAGVLLSVVLDANAQASFLLVLDARTLTELARATAPHVISLGFHGRFFTNLSADGTASRMTPM
jgi:beta,beta-carotene 9',10'-dioxygenase